jgi:glycosyltransferase involved in cell wall biosynthesis
MSPGTRALVYSPNLGGHRHIYSKKVIDALRDLGVEVTFAFCGIETNAAKRHFVPMQSPHVDALERRGDVTMLNISDRFSAGVDELKLIVHLQEEQGVEYTLFIDGDVLIPAFLEQLKPGRPRLRGRNFAIFILSEFHHMGSLKWRQFRDPKRRPHLRAKLFHRHLFQRFHLLDGGLYSDECLAGAMKSPKCLHLPEVGHTRVEPSPDPKVREFFGDVRRRYAEFLARHPDKEVILCFGDLEARKGYDFLVQLVAERPDLVLVRVGRVKPSYHHDWQTVLSREKIQFEGRLFEFEHYINDQALMDALFESISYLLLPYKTYYRTSSVMIQALSYGKPLLVSHVGLMRHRVEKNRLGRFFRDCNYASFVSEFDTLRGELESYAESIRAYYDREFSADAFAQTLAQTLENGKSS